MVVERAGREAHVGDDALVLVVVAVEDEGAGAGPSHRPPAAGRGVTIASRISAIPIPSLALARSTSSRGMASVSSSSSMTISGIGGGQVDLVDDRDDRQVLRHGEVDVGQRLGLDALGGVDDEDRALARLERAAHLVGEVDVARRVDEVERVGLSVGGVVLDAHGAGLDRDPLLALEVHRVEHLRCIWR